MAGSDEDNVMNRAQEYLKQTEDAFASMGHPTLTSLLLERGREFVPEPFTKQEQAILKTLHRRIGGRRTIALHGCYDASQRLLWASDPEHKLQYCEGHFCYGKLPIATPHAWLTIGGKLFDPMRWRLERECGHELAEPAYFGVEVDPDLLRKAVLKTKQHCSVLEAMPKEFFGAAAIEKLRAASNTTVATPHGGAAR